MKPFNLEAAKSGAPIVTRDGREARFIAYVPEAPLYSIVAYIKGEASARAFTLHGQLLSGEDSPNNLFMKPQKRTVWVNIVKPIYTSTQIGPHIHSRVYLEEEIAITDSWASETVLARAVPIEIEMP